MIDLERVFRLEFIVQFTGFYPSSTRSTYLNRIFQRLNLKYFQIVSRHNAMERFPSDFDVIRIQMNDEILLALRKHPLIRAVNPHRRIFRHLHSSKSNDDQIDGSPKRKLHRSPPNQIRIAESLQAPKLWKMGHRG